MLVTRNDRATRNVRLGFINEGLCPCAIVLVELAFGKAFVQHFESGGTLLDFNPPDYKEFIKAQKEMWDSRTKRSSVDAQTSHPAS